MFTNGWKECGQSDVPIKGVRGDILQQVIEYCYSGEIAIDSANVEAVLKAATMLQISGVQEECTEFCFDILVPSNCLGIREIADVHHMVRLKEEAHTFVLERFVEVTNGGEFYQLSVEQLSALLKHDEINVAEEEDVFAALIGWINHDVERRTKLLESLLECVRFQLIDESVSKQIPLDLFESFNFF